MSGTTLERLQVIIEASATKYKKEMDAVAQKTQKAEAIVDRCMSRVNSIVGKANTGNAGKTVDNLTAKLKRQQEAVDQQGFKIDNLRRKLLDLQSGNARNATIANLEAQLKAAEKEFAAVDKQMTNRCSRYWISSLIYEIRRLWGLPHMDYRKSKNKLTP